ncbi:multidrug resistance-associated protein 4-like isoform X1 [Branchiostoma floridae]|uniref:Multidrug resistance-associated protein 4-like isoform X1 n=1 Tax=Branchiostoma floridae TaxID=7739 RepID=A0A9J7HH82_BRAFL|nr:multidrug resistance-associated protein 4-like isoform X1 [Branchiostoma floridae]
MDKKFSKDKPNPIAKAGLLSKTFFWWLNPLFKTGYKRTLQEDDMYNVLYEDSSQKQTEDLEREWQKELDQAKESSKRPPSLRWALFRVFGVKFLLLGLCTLLVESIRTTQPIVLAWLIDYFSPETTVTTTQAYLYVLIISAGALAHTVIHHPYMFVLMEQGWRMRVACCGLIFRKALKLNNTALVKSNTGQIVNLMSNDVNRFDQGFMFFNYLWIGPLEILTVTILLYRDLGPSCLAGLGFMLVQLALTSAIGKLFSKYRSQTAQRTDSRIRTMSEIISAMRVIKMYTWEKPFSEMVAKLRKHEIQVVIKAAMCRGLNMALSSISLRMVVFFTFVTFALTGNNLSAGVVFKSIGLYNILQLAVMTFIPLAVAQVSEALVSIRRIQEFLLLDEIVDSETSRKNSVISVTSPQDAGCSVILDKVKAKWAGDSDLLTLKNISMKLKPGQLLAVIGPVGSGKSSLLSTVLQELPVMSGEVKVHGKVGYASQQPWVFSGTVRQNILFGRPYKEEDYRKTIQACALKKDLELLPHGDMTLVGDRGVTLSGGQKARINLARAVYHDADVYLLDDPLSAVDAEVGRHLFNRCIQGALRDKPRILVTHQLQYVQEADQILVLLEGEQVTLGTYSELLQSGIDFAKMMAREEEQEDEEDGRKLNRQLSKGSSRRQVRSRTFSEASSAKSAESDAEEEEVSVPLLEEEDRMTGSVGWTVYKDYFKAGAGVLGTLFAIVANSGYIIIYFIADWWLAYWARHEEEYRAAADNWPVSRNGYNATFLNGSDVVDFANTTGNSTALSISPDPPNMHFYIYIFTGLTAVALLLSLVKTWHLFYITVQSSKNLHNDMFNAIIRAPIRFFDTNPVGRILNRFSKDIGQLDDMFPWTFTDFIEGFLAIFGIIVLAGIINPWVFIPTIPLLLLFIYIRKYYLSTSRDIKRLEGTTRSPVFSHLSATLQGLWTIRAFGAQESFQQEFDAHQDLHSEAWFLFLAGSRWMSVRIDFLASLFVTAVTVCSVPASQALDGGLVGLSVTYAIMVTGFFQWVVRQSAEVENLMTSAERVVTYTKLEPEAPLTTGTKPPRDWPQCGGIELEAASFSYSEDGPDVLKKLCAVIRPQEKIGIVGRTGAGKSSLMQMLFRMAEPRGTVRIDGVDVTAIGLHDLRKKISVIPQDPVLFSGSLRRNLDPFNDFTDLQLWSAIEEVQLKQAVNELQGKLESEMAESGTNFSVGQRQLVCLARALLRRNRILIIDEATANVDPRTDQLIQETIREKFKNCTVLTIAHRLNTVIDSDRIMVLQEGRVQELGESHALLQDRDGVFTAMVDQSGKTLAAELREAARQCYIEKHGTDQVSEDSHTALTLCNVEFLTTV